MRRFLLVVFVFIFIQTLGCKRESRTKRIIAESIPPLASLARSVGGDIFEYVPIVPTSANPHVYEPLPKDIATAKRSALFIYVGRDVDPWAEKIAKESENRKIELLKALEQKRLIFHNPHVWLNPVLIPEIVHSIADTLCLILPESASFFRKNAENYIRKLETTFVRVRSEISKLPNRNILVYHGAWAPMLQNIGLNVVGIVLENPAQEPSARRISDIVKLGKETGVRVVVAESNFPVEIPQKIAQELGAELITANPLYEEDFIDVLNMLAKKIMEAEYGKEKQ